MRRYIRGTRIRPPIALFILPMIDVIFLLLLFFVMMTSFEASAKVRVEIPQPEKSLARRPDSAKQVVINCEFVEGSSAGSTEARYRIGADPPESLVVISARLAAARAAHPELTVIIRADRRLPFAPVREVMEVVADNGIKVMNVTARQNDTP